MTYLEDFVAGDAREIGSVTVDAAEIVAFASRYDPQPFHVDAARAAQTPYGGLIASGWHTCALTMRVLLDGGFVDGETSLGSPGLGPIHWKLPVRPGDTLHVHARVTEARRSQSKPDRGAVTLEVEVRNQRGETVMLIERWLAIVRARGGDAGATA